MTVRQLIAELQKHDQDSVVVLQLGRNELGNSFEVAHVTRMNAQRYESGEWRDTEWVGGYDVDDGYTPLTPIVNLTT